MSEPIIQGWCPGALRPMVSGDGWVVRLRPIGGRLDQTQAEGLGALALMHGNGLMDVSARANIQVRGVTEQSYRPLIEGLTRLGLIDSSAEAEARRNIIVTPFWSTGDGTQDLVAELAEALNAAGAPQLPSKFGFAVDCGSQPVLSGASADIRLERAADGGLMCRADGANTGAPISPASAVDAAMTLAHWFLGSGGVRGERGRMRQHLFGGAAMPDGYKAVPAQPDTAFSPLPGAVSGGVLVGFEFGQMRADTLMALAQHGALRATPWRMLLIETSQPLPTIDGLITELSDPMLRVTACSGKPACLQAHQPTRDLARRLAAHVPERASLHISGCAKGCAHPGPAAITLTAQPNGFDVVYGGRAGGTPQRVGLDAEVLAAHPALLMGML